MRVRKGVKLSLGEGIGGGKLVLGLGFLFLTILFCF